MPWLYDSLSMSSDDGSCLSIRNFNIAPVQDDICLNTKSCSTSGDVSTILDHLGFS